MKLTKQELENKYGLTVYAFWYNVPKGLMTRKMAKEKGVVIPSDAKPDAIKGNGAVNYHYPLFNINKYAISKN